MTCVALYQLLFVTISFTQIHTKMLRNDALISKMMSNFQKDNTITNEPLPDNSGKPKDVVSIMQNVLCRNFPTIPCHMIREDDALRKLIDKSIQQIKYKKLSIDKTTQMPGYHLTLFPVINSEDLSNYLQVSDTGFFKSDKKKHQKNFRSTKKVGNKKSNKNKRDSPKSEIYGRKKMRKFYPHKIKYKDKITKRDFDYNSEEKLSMSVEVPDAGIKHLDYRAESPKWRIDYTKHGEPGFNMFGYGSDRLQSRFAKTGPNVVVDDTIVEQAPRKDVMHTDVYIKNNFRKNVVDSVDNMD